MDFTRRRIFEFMVKEWVRVDSLKDVKYVFHAFLLTHYSLNKHLNTPSAAERLNEMFLFCCPVVLFYLSYLELQLFPLWIS